MIGKVQGSRYKVQGCGNGSQAFYSLGRNQGFTLLELIVVLFIVVLGFAAVGMKMSSGNDSTEHLGVARDIVSALRYARGQALMTRQEMAVTFDLTENNYTVSGRDTVYAIPQTIDLTLFTAQSELSGEGQGSVRFFSDGSSSGGRVTLDRTNHAWRIDINWLTGQIELEESDASG